MESAWKAAPEPKLILVDCESSSVLAWFLNPKYKADGYTLCAVLLMWLAQQINHKTL